MTFNSSLILTINTRNFPLRYWFYFLSKIGEIFWWQWQTIYLKNGKRFVRQKHSVRFKMIRKDESSRYLESQPIILTINPRIFPLFYWFYFLSKNGEIFWKQWPRIYLEKQKDLSGKSIAFVLK